MALPMLDLSRVLPPADPLSSSTTARCGEEMARFASMIGHFKPFGRRQDRRPQNVAGPIFKLVRERLNGLDEVVGLQCLKRKISESLRRHDAVRMASVENSHHR